jgi:pyruvate dehydrogenase kinase 2/3/4
MYDFWTSADASRSKLLDSGNFLRRELAVRLAHRLLDIHNLPFVCVKLPAMSQLLELHQSAFDSLKNFPAFNSLEQVERHAERLQAV